MNDVIKHVHVKVILRKVWREGESEGGKERGEDIGLGIFYT